MRKIFITTTLSLIASLFIAGSAMAFSLGGYLGELQFKFSNWETLVTMDDIESGESLFGLVRMTSIDTLGGDSLWQQGDNGEYITGWFQMDPFAVNTTDGVDFFFQNAEYHLFIDDVNPGSVPTFIDKDPASYASWLGDDSFLDFEGIPGFIAGQPDAEFFASLDSETGFENGDVIGYLNSTGGDYMSWFDSFFEVQATIDNTPLNGWAVISNDPVTGTAVPEPGTLLLSGLGLLGLNFIRRRRNK